MNWIDYVSCSIILLFAVMILITAVAEEQSAGCWNMTSYSGWRRKVWAWLGDVTIWVIIRAFVAAKLTMPFWVILACIKYLW